MAEGAGHSPILVNWASPNRGVSWQALEPPEQLGLIGQSAEPLLRSAHGRRGSRYATETRKNTQTSNRILLDLRGVLAAIRDAGAQRLGAPALHPRRGCRRIEDADCTKGCLSPRNAEGRLRIEVPSPAIEKKLHVAVLANQTLSRGAGPWSCFHNTRSRLPDRPDQCTSHGPS